MSAGPARGSEFIIRLPGVRRVEELAGLKTAAAPSTSTGAEAATVRPRVLVVDDNADAAEVLTLALGVSGYDARVAHDAPTALRVAAEFLPEVAVVDIGLPVMDGYELAAHLRDIKDLADLRLIAVTGYGQDSDRQKSRAAGFQHHLVKPVDIDALEEALRGGGSA